MSELQCEIRLIDVSIQATHMKSFCDCAATMFVWFSLELLWARLLLKAFLLRASLCLAR